MPGFMANSNTGPGLVVAKFETRAVASDAVLGSLTDKFERMAKVAAKIKLTETHKAIAVFGEPIMFQLVAKYSG